MNTIAELIQLRLKGQRPADPVVITSGLQLICPNLVIHIPAAYDVEKLATLDLTCLVGLDVLLVYTRHTNPGRVVVLSISVLKAKPANFDWLRADAPVATTIIENGQEVYQPWTEEEYLQARRAA
jgi:hypothetical protein